MLAVGVGGADDDDNDDEDDDEDEELPAIALSATKYGAHSGTGAYARTGKAG